LFLWGFRGGKFEVDTGNRHASNIRDVIVARTIRRNLSPASRSSELMSGWTRLTARRNASLNSSASSFGTPAGSMISDCGLQNCARIQIAESSLSQGVWLQLVENRTPALQKLKRDESRFRAANTLSEMQIRIGTKSNISKSAKRAADGLIAATPVA
jgi:hypothetical protein